MDEKDLIYVTNVADRYNNYLYPELRYHIENYLLNNIDKAIYYHKFNLGNNYLIQAILKNKEILNGSNYIDNKAIMDIIAPLVEREVFIRGI